MFYLIWGGVAVGIVALLLGLLFIHQVTSND